MVLVCVIKIHVPRKFLALINTISIQNTASQLPRIILIISGVAALHLYSYACVPEVSLCAFVPRTDDVNTPFEKDIKSLVRIFFVGVPISPNEGFQLSKELLNRI